MREKIKTIKFTAVACTIFAIFTYIVTLNMEMHFITLASPWLSNNFILTICGGIFASFFVVFLCEIQKYKSNKRNYENYLFEQAISMYAILHSANNNIKTYLERKSLDVPDNLLDQLVQAVLQYMTAIERTDYVTFSKKNELVKQHQAFRTEHRAAIVNIERSQFSIKNAILNVKLKQMNQHGCTSTVTSGNISDTLRNILEEQESFFRVVGCYLDAIDSSCKNRFGWAKRKEAIDGDTKTVLDNFQKN